MKESVRRGSAMTQLALRRIWYGLQSVCSRLDATRGFRDSTCRAFSCLMSWDRFNRRVLVLKRDQAFSSIQTLLDSVIVEMGRGYLTHVALKVEGPMFQRS